MTAITQQQIDDFKSLYPLNADIQALTMEALQEKAFDWKISFREQAQKLSAEKTSAAAAAVSLPLTPCQKAVGAVIFDAVCLAVGAIGLRSKLNATTIEAIFRAAVPAMSGVEQAIQLISQGTTLMDKAKGVYQILKAIYGGGSLGAVFKAFTGSLTWWDMALFGVTGLATIVAAMATDGLAFIAEVALLLTAFGFLASDTAKAVQACGLTSTSATAEGTALALAAVPAAVAPAAIAAVAVAAQNGAFPGWTQVPNSGVVSFITVLPDGTLAGIGMDHLVYTRANLYNTWTQVPGSGSITSLSASDGLFIATGTDNKLYFTSALGSPWTVAPNSVTLTCVTFLPNNNILGVGTDKTLYTCVNLNESWEQVPQSGGATSIAVMPDGTIACIGTDNLIYVRDDLTTPWVQVPKSGPVRGLTALPSAGVIVGLGMDGLLYVAPMM